MMKNKNSVQPEQVVRQQAYVIEKEYIDSMLNTACSDVFIQDAPVTPVSEVSEVSEVSQVSQVSQVSEASHHDHVDKMEPDINSNIECKVLRASGLNLALPLLNIKGILKQQEILLDMERFLETGLCIGSVNNADGAIDVIDLTYLIMNEISDFDCLKKYDGKRVNILLLEGSSVGILCEQDNENQLILQENVCWRNETSDRIWLAGTVKKQGLFLLDAEGILSLVNNKS